MERFGLNPVNTLVLRLKKAPHLANEKHVFPYYVEKIFVGRGTLADFAVSVKKMQTIDSLFALSNICCMRILVV